MSRFFRRFPLQVKLAMTMLSTVACTLILAALSLIAYEMYVFRGNALANLNNIAAIVGQGSVAALAFSDRAAAAANLATLQGEPRIAAAILYDKNGEILGSHWRPDTAPHTQVVNLNDFPLGGDYIDTIREIKLNNQVIGQLHLRRDLLDWNEKLGQYIRIVGFTSSLCLLVGVLLSSLLQRVFSGPILSFAGAARRIDEQQDYGARVEQLAEDELGYLARVFNQMMDGIERRDAELRLIQNDLEERVAARTSDLQNEIDERKKTEQNLLEAKHAAEKSNRAKSTFLATMSHELRTPLNAIIGYSEMLEEDAVESGEVRLAEDLGNIQAAGRHLLTLVNDVLDLSRIEAGHSDLRVGDIRVGTMVEEVASTAALLARKNGNHFEVFCEDRDLVLRIDPVKFRQSLYNLLSNACRFTEKGVVRLDVRKTGAGGRQWVEWAVSDTGIGIAAEHMDKLFDSFYQVDNSSTRKYGGTGLGLAISRRFCEMMGGTISVQSSPGVGSTFSISIPIKVAATAEEPDAVEPSAPVLTGGVV